MNPLYGQAPNQQLYEPQLDIANIRWTHYDDLRKETGCAMNLDLQRIAIPACDEAEARWMLKGRRPARIVVENPADRDILRRVADVPVLHLAELNQEPAHA